MDNRFVDVTSDQPRDLPSALYLAFGTYRATHWAEVVHEEARWLLFAWSPKVEESRPGGWPAVPWHAFPVSMNAERAVAVVSDWLNDHRADRTAVAIDGSTGWAWRVIGAKRGFVSRLGDLRAALFDSPYTFVAVEPVVALYSK